MHAVTLLAVCDRLAVTFSAGRSCQGSGIGVSIPLCAATIPNQRPKPHYALFSTRPLAERASTRPQPRTATAQGHVTFASAALCRRARRARRYQEATSLGNLQHCRVSAGLDGPSTNWVFLFSADERT